MSNNVEFLYSDLLTTRQLHFIKFGLNHMYKQRQTYLIMISSNLTKAMETYLCI